MSDAGNTVLSGTFTATGQSLGTPVNGRAHVQIDGGVGTVQIERSVDEAVSWDVLSKNSDGAAASYTTASDVAFNGFIDEPMFGVLYRFNCTAFTSGTIVYRLASR